MPILITVDSFAQSFHKGTRLPSSYSEALHVDGTAHLDRIDKLEYLNNKEERKIRLKQIFITHPSINNEALNLESQAAVSIITIEHGSQRN